MQNKQVPMKAASNVGHIIPLALAGVAALTALGFGGYFAMWRFQPLPVTAAPAVVAAATAATSSTADEVPTTAERLSATKMLTLCGISPELLAASGFNSSDFGAIMADMATNLQTDKQAFASSFQNHATAKRNAETLRRSVRSSTATETDRSNLATAETTLSTAAASVDTLKTQLLSRITGSLNEAKVRQLNRVLENHKQWKLPAQYLVIERSEAEWLHLRDALVERRIAAAKEQSPSEATTTFLEQVEGNPTVAAAAAALNSNRQTLISAWNNH